MYWKRNQDVEVIYLWAGIIILISVFWYGIYRWVN